MPYSTPTDASASVAFPAQGRTGHRRSFSHIIASAHTTTTPSSSSPSLGSLPRRRPTTSAPPVFAFPADDSPHKKPTFQLGRDDDDDDSSDEILVKTPLSEALRRDDDDRTLPPLRLKPKPSSFASAHRGSPPPQIHVQPPTSPAAVPFPRTSPTPSPSESQPTLPFIHTHTISDHGANTAPILRLVRPSVTRTESTPILLSNGKPLKSSLKGSSSSPNIPFPPQSLVPSIMFPDLHRHHHQRARSAPSTPHLDTADFGSSSPSPPSLESPSEPPSPTMPQKNVHFPSQEDGGLATVRVFNRSAKPASLSRLGEDTETETEGESSASGWNGLGWSTWGMRSSRTASYPFPRAASQNGAAAGNRNSPLSRQEEKILEVDVDNSTPVPARGAEKGEGNVYLESIGFVRELPKNPNPKRPLALAGTLLVRNVTYQKTVAVRFTMDDWHTTNDVLASYEKSLGALPARFVLGAAGALSADAPADAVTHMLRMCSPYAVDSPGDDVEVTYGEAPAWDRFRFEIQLEDLAGALEGRTMWLVGRYSAGVAPGTGGLEVAGAEPYAEWWDNNGGANYRVAFRRRETEKEKEKENQEYKRGVTVSAPSVYPANPRPTATSPAPKSYPAPPQISASITFPSSFSELRHQQQQKEQQAQFQVPQYTQQQHQPEQEHAYYAQHQPHQAAIAQSTLARLKKLSLRNYAAPAAYTGPAHTAGNITDTTVNTSSPQRALSTSSTSSISSIDSTDSFSTASSATSTDSTPLQTPTQDDATKVYVHQGPRHDIDLNLLEGAGSMHGATPDDDITDDAATPTFHGGPVRPKWSALSSAVSGAGAGAKEFAAALGAGAEVFKLRLGGGGSPASSGTSTPVPRNTTNANNANANTSTVVTPTPTAAFAMDIGRCLTNGNLGVGSPSEMGTSPPFSVMADMGLGATAMRAEINTNANSDTTPSTHANVGSPLGSSSPNGWGTGYAPLYWPWGSFGAVGGRKCAVEAAEKQESVMEEEKPESQQKEGLVTPPLSPPVASLLSDIIEKNVGGPINSATPTSYSKTTTSTPHRYANMNTHSSATAQIVPPHRRRTAHSHATNPGGGGSASPSGGSASSSGSEATGGRRHHYRRLAGTGNTSPSSPLSPTASLPSQASPQSQLSSAQMAVMWGMRPGSPRPGSPRPGSPRPSGMSSPSAAGVRSPLRLSPVQSFAELAASVANSPSPPYSSAGNGSSTTNVNTSVDGGSGGTSTPTSPGGQDDAVYQAFVRQWCFAQAPGPTVGASVGGGSAPNGPMPMPISGVERGVGEGPRLVVG